MARRQGRFDGACEIAALVYGPREAPDRVVGAFAQSLIGRGFDVVGLLQAGVRPGGTHGHAHAPALTCFPLGPRFQGAACGAGHDGAADWRALIASGQHWLLGQMARRPDLVLLNRYGAAERSGGGLVEVIAEAAEREIPLILPVPEAHFEAWLRFSEGMFVKLACHMESLEHWWAGLSHPDRPGETLCARSK